MTLEEIIEGISPIALQEAAEGGAERRVLQAERDIGFEVAELVAAIVAPGGDAHPVKLLARGDQPVEPVGQLDLVAAARFERGQMAEDFRLDDVAPDDGQG